MVAEAEITFRLRGIPCEYTGEDVERFVKENVLDGDDIDVSIRSLSRDPFSPSQQATLSFTQIPQALSGKHFREHFIDLFSRNAGLKSLVGRLQFDTHFKDLTPFHSTKDEDCKLDIIAISGLNGHAFGSFKQKDHDYMWIRDALPTDLPRARIFTYGYDTRSQAVQNVDDLGSNLRTTLCAFRESSSDARPNPLVLIAHSLGGIVVKSFINWLVQLTRWAEQPSKPCAEFSSSACLAKA